ncbi:hypothetical protein [Streptomyces sp. NPDC093970]
MLRTVTAGADGPSESCAAAERAVHGTGPRDRSPKSPLPFDAGR